jgi:hypothetical protein
MDDGMIATDRAEIVETGALPDERSAATDAQLTGRRRMSKRSRTRSSVCRQRSRSRRLTRAN